MCNNIVMTDYSEFAPSKIAGVGLRDEVKKLMKEDGLSESEALRVAASTMSGAGDNPSGTVESVQTCTDLEGRAVPGLTGDDIPAKRNDSFAKTEAERHDLADKGKDEAAEWLRNNDPLVKRNRG
jgi:hypothetical protein